jgi:hypothetical protein
MRKISLIHFVGYAVFLRSLCCKPDFFEKLMGAARGMNDDRLEGDALEGYFHSLVRDQISISVNYCK